MNWDSHGERSRANSADLVVLRDGRPTAVVEAKGIPVPADFRRPVLAQIRHYARLTHSRWAILADPVSITVFSGDAVEQPVATIPSGQLLDWAGLRNVKILGESTLLLAIERWLTNKERLAELPALYPALGEFARDMSESEQVLTDARI